MCGICGAVYGDGRTPDQASFKKANDLIAHRGPDDEGYHLDGPVGLAMRRLAIIDLSTGRQPLSYAEGALWIVLNGEIYNYLELRAELEGRGRRFKTKSDTEVVLALYQEMGPRCVQKLRGMFAFAVWDKNKRRLFIARDRIGKKPLVYAERPGGTLLFSSELRCLFALDESLSHQIDPIAIDMYLSLQYIPSPRTVYRDVKKLPPGHTLIWENGRTTIERYWDLPVGQPPITTDVEEAKRLLRDKLTESVRLRMISDVPLGAFLSGGVDSSIIVALMSGLSSKPVKTFSIGFDEERFSETHYAKMVADRYKTDHTEFVVKPEMADILPKLAWHYGEPYADASALPTYYVSRETRKFVTVALNGDGGDENFGGYLRYFAMKAARLTDSLPGPVRSALKAGAELLPEHDAPLGMIWRFKRFLRSTLFNDLPGRHLRMICYFAEDEKPSLYAPEFVKALGPGLGATTRYMADAFTACEGEDFVNRMLYVDFKTYLPECLMAKVDIASMACSLEGRSPLLDHEFVELAYRMPGNWKLKGLRGHKWIFKEAFKDLLPPEILTRGKMGFGIPLGSWLRGPLKDYWAGHVLSREALSRGYFTQKGLRCLWDEHQGGRRDHGYRLWALLMLELWHRYADGEAGLIRS
ncbi:MAG TPA: asparagine synthase (glutamine-hydrolyzing) [Elusimicrobia bacterium]|nr:MAG: asparagine synthase (glutamine-hydrolyzing) [Elusimicrobia bacterium GWA2_66_18]OGR73644.1 MAG: asparagine synthase (glutamine-hydrolyzing) [Elusimicrobia bacterium GWC2_65_9]HAZ07736.1 asparagine synthase (glutamine-hydrolyzing) [Elusimicrobiota bacterium]